MSELCQQSISQALNQDDTFTENPEDLDVWPMWLICVHCCDAHRGFTLMDGGVVLLLRICSMLVQEFI